MDCEISFKYFPHKNGYDDFYQLFPFDKLHENNIYTFEEAQLTPAEKFLPIRFNYLYKMN